MDLKELMKLKAASGGSGGSSTVEDFQKAGNPIMYDSKVAKGAYGLIVSFEPVQSGIPSPGNVCPISGFSNITVNAGDGTTTTKQYTVQLGNTYYGGTLDMISGILTVEWEMQSGTWGSIKSGNPDSTTGFYGGSLTFTKEVTQCTTPGSLNQYAKCNCLSNIMWKGAADSPEHFYIYNNKAYIYGNFADDQVVQIVAKLAHPYTVQLTGIGALSLDETTTMSTEAKKITLKYKKRFSNPISPKFFSAARPTSSYVTPVKTNIVNNTTISNTKGKSITVTQIYNPNQSITSLLNGALYIDFAGMNELIENNKTTTLHCHIEITNNPADVSQIRIKQNSMGSFVVTEINDTGDYSIKILYKNRPNDYEHIEMYCCGMSFIISDVKLSYE